MSEHYDVIIIGTGAGGGNPVNPALTAMATALRVGDHLLERLDAPIEQPIAAAGDDAHPLEVLS